MAKTPYFFILFRENQSYFHTYDGQNQSGNPVNKCGSGKSVTFTIPAIYTYKKLNKCTLVIEPSVTLIQDQVASLVEHNVDAIALGNSAQSDKLINFNRLIEGRLPVMAYCTPEYLMK